MNKKKFRWWHFLLALVLLGIIFLALSSMSSAPQIKRPNPNGYADFQKAFAVTTGDSKAALSGSVDELRTFVATNRDALRLVRDGLSKQCQVPVDYTPAYLNGHMPELPGMKGLAQALKAEGQLAEKENRIPDAIQSYLDGIRFGHEISRGGLLIDSLIGNACEAIAMQPLNSLRGRLGANDCRQAAKALEAIDAQRESLDAVLAHERIWAAQTGGWRYRVFAPILRRMLKPAIEKAELKIHFRVAHLRLLMIELALRSYRMDKGSLPRRLDELAPAYLKTIPSDPFGGKPFVYRPETGSFKLYSVGPDGKDDGGVSLTRTSATPPPGDLLTDSPY